MSERTTVRCKSCGKQQDVEIAKCISTGWPECCGTTMSLNPTEPISFTKAMDEVLGPVDQVMERLHR